MDQRDKAKTAFTAHCGTYQYTRMPFGLKNAPATFQRAWNMILAGYRWKTCLVYIDDVIVFSKTFNEHLAHVREVFAALSRSGITLKPSKCTLFSQTVDYLGHRVAPGRLEVAMKNTEPLKRCPFPTTQTDLRSFLGLCNVYRRFVPNFARVAAPLNALLRKGCTKVLPPATTEQVTAFELLRGALISAPILRLPDFDKPFSVDN